MPERLRGMTRNHLGFACAGSSPAVDVLLHTTLTAYPMRRGFNTVTFFYIFFTLRVELTVLI
jgi:hypothetical protein